VLPAAYVRAVLEHGGKFPDGKRPVVAADPFLKLECVMLPRLRQRRQREIDPSLC
jgi:hypothetical protein